MRNLIATLVERFFISYDTVLAIVARMVEFDDKKDHDVFISYTEKDLDKCKVLEAALGERGLSNANDRKILRVGDTWNKELERKVRDASCVIVIWTSNSIAKQYVVGEAALAKMCGTLLPCRSAKKDRQVGNPEEYPDERPVERDVCPFQDNHIEGIATWEADDDCVKRVVDEAIERVKINKRLYLRFRRRRGETINAYRIGGAMIPLVVALIGFAIVLTQISAAQIARYSQPIRDIELQLSFQISAIDFANACEK